MALYLKNFNLDFLAGDEDTFMGFVSLAAKEGKGITGYYGLPYINQHFGDVQMILRLGHRENGEGYEVQGVDSHAQGRAIWECRLNSMEINRKDADVLSRRIVVNQLNGKSMAVVTLVNADVLPSFLEGDTIKMQMIGLPEIIEYFEDEEAYAATQPELQNGHKLLVAEGSVIPSGFMRNRNPDDPEFESDEHLDDLTIIRGTVNSFQHGRFGINGELHDTFVICNIDTVFGPLQIVHSIDQVKEEQRKNMKKGAVVNFCGLLSGDPAIYEYDKGIIRDEEHDLAAMRYMYSGNDPERIRSILSDDCVYYTEYHDMTFTGPDAIIERMKIVQRDHKGKYYAHLATIDSVDDGDKELDYKKGKRCIILASGEETKFESIAFIDINDDGYISRILTTSEPRYRFVVDKKPEPENPLEDVKLPESVVEPILLRARFYGVINEETADEAVLSDTKEDAIYKDNACLMLEAMPETTDKESEELLTNLFGYLFAKAIEMEHNQKYPSGDRGIFNSEISASYAPDDAWEGKIHSVLDDPLHEKLVAAMELGCQFYKDFKFYQENIGHEDYDDNMMKALVTDQRLGRLYSEKCLMVTAEEREAIRTLGRMLKARGINKEKAIDISMMVRKGDKRDRLIEWMEKNPNATAEDICNKGLDLSVER